MNQSRLQSLVEAMLNTFIGFLVTFAAYPVATALSGVKYSSESHWIMVSFFTVVSIARQYALRRWCNAYLHKIAQAAAGYWARRKEPPIEYVVQGYTHRTNFGRNAMECTVLSSDGIVATETVNLDVYPDITLEEGKNKAYWFAVKKIKAIRKDKRALDSRLNTTE